jgi:non-specific serine/threonine protein kinase
MIGRTISHYKILEKLGGGGMGVVYKAQDLKLDRIVALKFLPPDLTRDPEAKARFIHEAKAASALQHDNICTIHDIDEEPDGQLFLSMDFYDGETLKEKIERGPLPIDEAIDLAMQISRGLAKAHEAGMVHRDIKPANIIVTQEGEAKIVDFGLAKLAGQTKLTKAGSTLGTAAYMSPEQARGEESDRRSDIWSLGVVLYEMIAGRPPFKGDYENALMYSILNVEPEPITGLRTGVPMELERIVTKCLKKKAADRYQNLADFLVDLKQVRKVSEGQSGSAAASLSAAGVPLKSRKPKVALAIAGCFVIAAFAFASWLLLGKHDSPLAGEKEKSFAVLPFASLGESQEDKQFADGIHDEILTQFVKIGQLKVLARTSVLQYRDTKKRMNEIGKELGVSYLVEGTVQRSGNRILIRAQLIDAQSEQHVWAERYDRPYADIFSIQAEVAKSIASAVGGTLTVSEKEAIEAKPTENMQAYDFFLRGMYYWRSEGSMEANDKAIAMFEKAVELDPRFAKAQAWIAYVHCVNYIPAWDRSPARREKAKRALEKAIAIDPNLPEVHLATAEYAWLVEADFERAESAFKQALAARPNDAELRVAVAHFYYRGRGEPDQAIPHATKETELNPYAPQSGDMLSLSWQLMHNWDEAAKWAQFQIAHGPDVGGAYLPKCYVLLFGEGDIKEVRVVYNERFKQATKLIVPCRELEWHLELYARNYEAALDTLKRVDFSKRSGGFATYGYSTVGSGPTCDWAMGWTYSLLGEKKQAASYYEKARESAATRAKEQPSDGVARIQLGLACAGLGQRVQAINEANEVARLSHLTPPTLGSYRSDFGSVMRDVAHIYIMTGEHEKAISILDSLLSVPSVVSKTRLRLDPMYDAIRNNPRFEALLAKEERIPIDFRR